MGIFNFLKNNSSHYNYEYLEDKTPLEKLYDEYRPIIEKHLELSQQINIKYSIAINQPTIFNKYTEECEQLCLEDIALNDKMKELEIKEANLTNTKVFNSMYESFVILSKIHEKKGNIDGAIFLCIQSIRAGFLLDGTKGGMQGRLSRLIKKFNKENNTNYMYDYDKNIMYDNITGEVVDI